MTNALSTRTRGHDLLKAAKDLAQEDKAPATLRTYAALWRNFEQFCAEYGATPLPANFAAVIAYITHCAKDEGQAVQTIRSKLAAIRHFHGKARAPDPTADPAVEDVLEGISRHYGAPPDQKAAVALDELRALLAVQPLDLRGTRNRALLLLAYACDLRRSEVVALTVADVQFLPDRMVVLIRQSKTDQLRQGFRINVPRMQDKALCPAHALETWLTVAQIKAGPLFRKIDRWDHVGDAALTDQVVADIIKNAAAGAGLDPARYAGHSTRRGLITQAARNHETSLDIRTVSRHQSERMVSHYVEAAAATQMELIGKALGG